MTKVAVTPIKILIADDHPVVRIGLRNMLQADNQMRIVAEAKDGAEALDMVRTLPARHPAAGPGHAEDAGHGRTTRTHQRDHSHPHHRLDRTRGQAADPGGAATRRPRRGPERRRRRTSFGLYSRRHAGPVLAGGTSGAEPGAGAARSGGANRPAFAQDLRSHRPRA